MKLEKQAKILKERTKTIEKGKIKYFWLFPCSIWSIQHFISWSTNMFGLTKRNETHTIFYNTLYIFRDDPNTSQEILEVVRDLLLKKKICIFYFTGQTRIFQIWYVKHKKLSLGDI